MRRFRRLTKEEFQAVESEFIQFLASEGITADDWAQKQDASSSDVSELLDAFSTLFWEGATHAISYLEHQPDPSNLWAFHFAETQAHALHCQREENTITWSQGGKTYEFEARGQEIFLLLEQGAKPCSEERFKALHNEMVAFQSLNAS